MKTKLKHVRNINKKYFRKILFYKSFFVHLFLKVSLQAEVNSFDKLNNFMKEFSIIEKLWNGIKEWNEKIVVWGVT